MTGIVSGPFGAAPARHVFGEPASVPPSLELARHQQTERTCALCGAVKVTVHAPDGSAWREWRVSSSSAQLRLDDDLPCRPQAGEDVS